MFTQTSHARFGSQDRSTAARSCALSICRYRASSRDRSGWDNPSGARPERIDTSAQATRGDIGRATAADRGIRASSITQRPDT